MFHTLSIQNALSGSVSFLTTSVVGLLLTDSV